MEQNRDWDKEIINITMKIQKDFPELTKFIAEMPVKTSDEKGINVKNLEEYYNSLVDLIGEYAETHVSANNQAKVENFPGYPLYPASEDIYRKGKKEMDMNPSDLSKKKSPNVEKGLMNEKGFEDDMSGDDLDVPGSELDDQQESVGSEDEENNYYSLGGDAHSDLDED
ncbi:hypothetical protein [Lacihabitans sp. LS3-19]|uniref:hypothetical protein n=1 Tax=Lacihabitans sp. LS3-19 TaxID=2487335 RepID=UPI0020CDB307|nr:hypothetical protein [Lacihabitans sp. LS3-19]